MLENSFINGAWNDSLITAVRKLQWMALSRHLFAVAGSIVHYFFFLCATRKCLVCLLWKLSRCCVDINKLEYILSYYLPSLYCKYFEICMENVWAFLAIYFSRVSSLLESACHVEGIIIGTLIMYKGVNRCRTLSLYENT